MRTKLILATLTATLLITLATTNATARNISISHGELFSATWRQLRFVSGGSTSAACDVTIEGSFHYRTIFKARDSLVGYITRGIAGNCERGSATVLTTNLPWHIRYQGFQGMLPNITGIRFRLILGEFKVHTVQGPECLARSTSTEPTEGAVSLTNGTERRLVTGFTPDPNARILCRETLININGGFEGTGVVREVPGENTNLLVRLI
jgi:hypothetical protein